MNLVAPVRLVNGLHFASRSGARVISLTSSSNLTITKDLNFEACARNVELLGEECPSQKPYCLAKLGLVAMSKHFATTRGKHDDGKCTGERGMDERKLLPFCAVHSH